MGSSTSFSASAVGKCPVSRFKDAQFINLCQVRFLNLGFVAALFLVPMAGRCAPYPGIPVHGSVAEKAISTTVDSELAKYYLKNHSTGEATNPTWDARIADIEQRFKSRPLNWSELKEISDETSPDFATLFFIRQTLSDTTNERFQTNYAQEVKRVKSRTRLSGWAGIVRSELKQYKLLFVPGFHYVSDKTSGADFFYERQFMSELGLNVRLVATEEDGTVEDNAALIADAVRAESGGRSRLILVSTSKGGPETALALGKLLQPNETGSVKAWVSVGGLMRGTFLADEVTSWPESTVARVIFLFEGMQFRGVAGLTTSASQKRMNAIRLPRSILIIQFVAAPLSGDISGDVRSRYLKLRRFGPNDGLTLLADEFLPSGITIFEPGLDHFYQEPDIYLKSLALLNIIADALVR